MSIKLWKFDQLKLFLVLLVMATIASPTNGLIPRKLDDTTVPAPPDSSVKCGSCSACNNPCSQSSPPPPPPVMMPPPPPPAPKKPSPPYCPPPPLPPSPFLYITGPPGNLYPIDPYYSGSGRRFAVGVGLPVLVGCGLVGLLAFG